MYLQNRTCSIMNAILDILFTNSRLAKIGLYKAIFAVFATLIDVPEAVDHFFCYCAYLLAFLPDFESYWIVIAKGGKGNSSERLF